MVSLKFVAPRRYTRSLCRRRGEASALRSQDRELRAIRCNAGLSLAAENARYEREHYNVTKPQQLLLLRFLINVRAPYVLKRHNLFGPKH